MQPWGTPVQRISVWCLVYWCLPSMFYCPALRLSTFLPLGPSRYRRYCFLLLADTLSLLLRSKLQYLVQFKQNNEIVKFKKCDAESTLSGRRSLIGQLDLNLLNTVVLCKLMKGILMSLSWEWGNLGSTCPECQGQGSDESWVSEFLNQFVWHNSIKCRTTANKY